MILAKILAWLASPTLFKMQESRVGNVSVAFEGLRLSGIPLVSFSGGHFAPSGVADDIGLYYFVPKLMIFLDAPLQTAFILFFGAVIFSAMIMGIAGSWLLFSEKKTRGLAIAGVICASLFSALMWDVYVLSGAVPIALIPFFLYFLSRKKITLPFYIFGFSSGLLASVGNLIRSHAGTPVMLFFAIAVVFYLKESALKKGLLFLIIFLGLSLPSSYFNMVIEKRDFFLHQTEGEVLSVDNAHPFWHSVYIGLGYLKNNHGLIYKDEVAFSKSQELLNKKSVPFPEHERVIKQETLKFIREHPFFTLKTLIVKAGVTLFYLILFANVGLLAAFRYRKPIAIDVGFAVALSFLSLIGLLVIPHPKYMLGFITMSCIYGFISMCFAIEKGRTF